MTRWRAQDGSASVVGKLLEEQDGDVLREGTWVLSQALMESEVAGLIGAERHERTGERDADATALIIQLLTAPTPIVPPALAAPRS